MTAWLKKFTESYVLQLPPRDKEIYSQACSMFLFFVSLLATTFHKVRKETDEPSSCHSICQ